MAITRKPIDLLKKKNIGAKPLVLAASVATLVASGSSSDGTGKLVIVGITSGGTYTAADLANIAGTGVDLSADISVEQANSNSAQTIGSGETIDGGTDGKVLYAFGKVDLTGITLSNITKIYLDNEVVISNASIVASGVSELLGSGTIKADTGLLDLDGITVATAIDIKDSDGNIVVPLAGTGAIGATLSLAENISVIGNFSITDASAVGTVTYVLSGADAALFVVDGNGVINFITAPDFESAADQGNDNVYDITVTATDEHGKSTSQTIAITITNVNDAPKFVGATAGQPLVINVNEEQSLATTLNITDDEGHAFGRALSGTDASLFSLIGDNLFFNAYPNFEAPIDAGQDNVYDLIITAVDQLGATTIQAFEIRVADVADADMSLGTLNGVRGFRLDGAAAGDYSGGSVSFAGDVNGDGFDDIIVGAYFASPNNVTGSGASYVIFGKATGFDPVLNLGSLSGADVLG